MKTHITTVYIQIKYKYTYYALQSVEREKEREQERIATRAHPSVSNEPLPSYFPAPFAISQYSPV